MRAGGWTLGVLLLAGVAGAEEDAVERQRWTLEKDIIVEAKAPAPRVVFVDGGIEQARRKMQALLSETRAGAMYSDAVSRPETLGRQVGVVVVRWPREASGKMMRQLVDRWTVAARGCEQWVGQDGATVKLAGKTRGRELSFRPLGAHKKTALGQCLKKKARIEIEPLAGPVLFELTFAGR